MLSARFFIVVAVLFFMVTAGFRRMDLLIVLPWGMAIFFLAWLLRPLKELRRAMKNFQQKVLMKKKADMSDVLVATALVAVTYILVPFIAYASGYILSLIWRTIVP